MDRLEKFITENRQDMDRGVPDLKVWANIDKKLEEINAIGEKKAKVVPLWKRFKAAAAVLILLTVGAGGGHFFMNNSSSSENLSLAQISPQHAETEQYYSRQVEQKIQQLASYKHDDTVQEDLEQLDKVYEELMIELKDAPKGTEEYIIKAMIKNYQAKIDILEHVIEKVEGTNQAKKETKNEISI